MIKRSQHKFSLYNIATSMSAIVVLASVIVMFGWIIRSPSIVQIYPEFAPMQFNTALCFFLASLSMVFIRYQLTLAALIAVILFLFSGATMAQYIFAVNFHIDQLFVEAFTNVKTTHPGRMAPNTAIAFMLTSAIVILYSAIKPYKIVLILALILTAILLAIPLLAGSAYVMGIHNSPFWFDITKMAVHTSICFIFISVALLLIHFSHETSDSLQNHIIYPLITFFSGLFISCILFISTNLNQENFIQKNIAKEGKITATSIEKVLEGKLEAIYRLFYRSKNSGYTNKSAVISDMNYYLLHMEALIAVSTQPNNNMPIIFRHTERVSLKQAEADVDHCRTLLSSSKENVYATKKGLVCVTDQQNSYAVLRLAAIIDAVQPDFFISVHQDGTTVYTTNHNEIEQDNASANYQINVWETKWRINLIPREQLFQQYVGNLPLIILMFGLAITIILTALVYIWQKRNTNTALLSAALKQKADSEKNVSTMIEKSREAILIINQKGDIIFANHEASHLWKRSIQELTAIDLSELLSNKRYELIHQKLAKLDKVSKKGGKHLVTTIHDVDGEAIRTEMQLSAIEFGGDPCLLCSFIDVTESYHLQENLKEQARNTHIIYETANLASELDDTDTAYQRCLDTICHTLQWPIGHVYLYNPKTKHYEPSSIWFYRDDEKVSAFRKETNITELRKGEGFIGTIALTQKPLWIEDVDQNDIFTRKSHMSQNKSTIRSGFGFPIIVAHEVVAVFEFLNFEPTKVDEKLLDSLAVLGHQLGRIIERKASQHELVSAETRNRLLLNSAGEGIYGIDTNGRLTFVNSAAKKMLGYTDRELIGQVVHDIFHHSYPDGSAYPKEKCPMYNAFVHGIENRVSDEVLWKKDGSPLWVEYVSTPVYDNDECQGAVVIFNDISEKIALQKAKDEQAAYHEKVLNCINDYAIISLNTDGHILSWNKGAERVYGYQQEEVIGKHFAMLYEDDSSKDADLLLTGANTKGHASKSCWSLQKNNTHFWADITVNAMYKHNEEVIGFVHITRNMTDQKLAQEKLMKYSEQLKASNQALDDFAYIASHDLKEPLRGISNYAQFIHEDYADKLDDTGKEYVTTLTRLSKRLESFIDALLEYSRVGKLDHTLKKTDLNVVISEKLDLLSNFLKNHHADVKVLRPLPSLVCDRVQIGEVFQNLITNGIKYNDAEHKHIVIDYELTPEKTTFSVQDNGIGIPEKFHDKIFKIFKRLHGKDAYGGGTGAGMTIVKKIVESHGGKIWVSSKEGEGSTFFFSISNQLSPSGEKHES